MPSLPTWVRSLITGGSCSWPPAQVVVEQFRPGVADRLGIGYDQLHTVNPGVVYCSISGYGQHSELRDRAGHDLNYLAQSGLLGVVTDTAGLRQPCRSATLPTSQAGRTRPR